jgi:hypothetical protein
VLLELGGFGVSIDETLRQSRTRKPARDREADGNDDRPFLVVRDDHLGEENPDDEADERSEDAAYHDHHMMLSADLSRRKRNGSRSAAPARQHTLDRSTRCQFGVDPPDRGWQTALVVHGWHQEVNDYTIALTEAQVGLRFVAALPEKAQEIREIIANTVPLPTIIAELVDDGA